MAVKAESRYSASAKKVASVSQDYELWVLLEQACHMALETSVLVHLIGDISPHYSGLAVSAMAGKTDPQALLAWGPASSQSG